MYRGVQNATYVCSFSRPIYYSSSSASMKLWSTSFNINTRFLNLVWIKTGKFFSWKRLFTVSVGVEATQRIWTHKSHRTGRMNLSTCFIQTKIHFTSHDVPSNFFFESVKKLWRKSFQHALSEHCFELIRMMYIPRNGSSLKYLP